MRHPIQITIIEMLFSHHSICIYIYDVYIKIMPIHNGYSFHVRCWIRLRASKSAVSEQVGIP